MRGEGGGSGRRKREGFSSEESEEELQSEVIGNGQGHDEGGAWRVDSDGIREEDLNDPRAANEMEEEDLLLMASVDENELPQFSDEPLVDSLEVARENDERAPPYSLGVTRENDGHVPPYHLKRDKVLPSQASLLDESFSLRGLEMGESAPRMPSEISYPEEYDWEGMESALEVLKGRDRQVGAAPGSKRILPTADAALTELETAGYSLQEIVAEPKFRKKISADYERFLTSFTDEQGQSVYHGRIKTMCAANGESLEVSYVHLVETNAFLAKLLANVPLATLAIFDETTMRVVLRLFEEYSKIKPAIHVRITDFPGGESLRNLRYNHLDTLVRVSGVVTRRSGVFPQLQLVKYDCGKCGAVLGPFVQDLQQSQEVKITACSECGGRGPFTVNATQTVYRNYQKLTLQESPGSVPAGRLPRHREVVLLYDLIDCARPGELVEVTGVYRNNFSYALNGKNGFPVFATLIEANWVGRREGDIMGGGMNMVGGDGGVELGLTEEDQREIRKLAEDPRIGHRIVSSIAPSIYGHYDIKLALALSLFGGQAKNVQGKHAIRGDINVLLLGDPGTAKSQFLKYIEKTAPRAVYATGQGASAVGLTASVRKDPVTREWTLEGGALVLADKGVCCIDEFDKMNESDRTSIHEAMEQQSISVSKAGIVASLQARCAVIAAANPTRGRYNPTLTFGQNVQLTEPILSRFDILCVVRDTVDGATDERLARFVVGSHIRSGALNNGSDGNKDALIALADELQAEATMASRGGANLPPLEQGMLKKYILYAKSRIRPELSQMDVDKIARLYADLRRESLATGSIPITVRHVESMVRMAEAHAKMHLRDMVRSDDIDVAIRVMLESFIGSQKYAVMNHLRRAFSKYLMARRDVAELTLCVLGELLNERAKFVEARGGGAVAVEISEVQARLREVGVFDVKSVLGRTMLGPLKCHLQGGQIVRD